MAAASNNKQQLPFKSNMAEKVCIEVTILQGSDLVAKDRDLFGRKTTSDPYVEIWAGSSQRPLTLAGRTKTMPKTLNPTWDNKKRFHIVLVDVRSCPFLTLKIFDQDKLSAPDSMGTITIPITKNGDTTEWYEIPPDSAKNAKGKLQVRLQTNIIKSRALVRGNEFELTSNQIQVGLAWDMLRGKDVDLDVSCVSISSAQGQVSMQDTVYYANTCNSNNSVVHSGDEREGDEVGDDETITFQLDKIPFHVLAMYILLTVATPTMRIPDIQSTTMRVYDISARKKLTLCSFTPASHVLSRDSTAMFMVRIARCPNNSTTNSSGWLLSPIEDTHPTARDFGSLVPHFKHYTKDLLPSIYIDPTERVAILRKGGNVRLTDYCPDHKIPSIVTFGLAWDVTEGVNIDLDASCICLDSNLNFIDQVWWSQLKSKDGSIRHHGDEREGDEIGDDEKIDIHLARVSPSIQYIGIVINSYSGQELDDVARASCHLFDPQTNRDMASYALTDSRSLDGYTGLVVGCLYRGGSSGEWGLCIISEAGQGKLARDLVDELQNYLRRNKPQALLPLQEEEEIVLDDYQMPANVPLRDEEIDLSIPSPAYNNYDEEIDLTAPAR
jgi:tellurium resistance protein TerZ